MTRRRVIRAVSADPGKDDGFDGGLAGAVGTPEGAALAGGAVGEEDGTAGVGRAQERVEGADQPLVGEQVDGENPLEGLGIELRAWE